MMRNIIIAAALLTAASAPAFAQQTTTAAAPAQKFSTAATPISDLWKNEQAKAIVLKALPPLEQYIDQIGTMTLAQVAPMSQGAIDDAKLKEIDAELAKIQ